jgi:hypothetical protein
VTNSGRKTLQIALAAAAGVGLFMINDVAPTGSGFFVSKARAIIGRPMTPMSYAGVARRTTRRATYGYGAAAAGAAAYGAATYGAGNCVQVADAYGRLVTQCY